MKQIIIILLTLLLVSTAQADKATQAVNDYCACAKPAFEKHKEIMEAFKNQMKNPDKAEEISRNIEEKTVAIARCFQELNKKYKEEQKSEEFQKKVNAGIKKQCPKPAIKNS